MQIHRLLTGAVVACAAIAPTFASAAEWRPTSGQGGFERQPQAAQPTRDRAAVLAELSQARKDGNLLRYSHAAPIPSKQQAAPRSRAEVIGELKRETPQQRDARLSLLPPG